MQDTLDITGVSYEYDFIWLYVYNLEEPLYTYNHIKTGPQQWCGWQGYKGANLPHDK